MKRIAAFLLIAVAVSVFAACGDEIPYYHQESSRTEQPETVSDPVPAFVFGEKGFYDTENDIEYVVIEGLKPKQRGELFATGTVAGKEKRFYEIENEHPTYFVCDDDGTVYKNTMMPMMSMPGQDDFEKQYPGLASASE